MLRSPGRVLGAWLCLCLPACSPLSDREKAGIDAVLLGVAHAAPENKRAANTAGRLELNLTPEIPRVMHAGDRLVVSVNPALKSGAPCRMCTVKWTTASPSTAEWSSFATSGTGHLATLTALSPGQVRLVVEVCPGVYFKCQQTTFASKIVE